MLLKRWWAFLALYFIIRLVSFVFFPDTPLHGASPINTILAGGVLFFTVYFLFKKNPVGWYIVAAEMILGGAGNFFAFLGISLRTCLLFASLGIFLGQEIFLLFRSSQFFGIGLKNFFVNNRWLLLSFGFLYLAVGIAAIRGLMAGHDPRLIFADTTPYLFFLYYFPLKKLFTASSANFFKQIALEMLIATAVGNVLFMLFTFFGFSTGLFELQDTYYHWFRDVANGKITELPFSFYRIVLNEHLLLIPLALFFMHLLIERFGKNARALLCPPSLALVSLLAVLGMNLTRIYMVALGIGTLLLFRRDKWRQWMVVAILSALFFVGSFSALHLLASRGHSLGFEIFGLRLQSIVTPQIENSSLSRLLLLPKIMEKIKAAPVFGAGLADSVTVYSPVFKSSITTPHFDWGYLEIIAEMGLFGLLAWLFLIFLLLLSMVRYAMPATRWWLATLGSLLIIHTTSPALFHAMGIMWLTLLLAMQMAYAKDYAQAI